MKHYVYVLNCSDKTFYTGYTNDLGKRVVAHNSLKSGAKYTRGRRPVKLVYSENFKTKSEALKREIVLKKMGRDKKLELTGVCHPELVEGSLKLPSDSCLPAGRPRQARDDENTQSNASNM